MDGMATGLSTAICKDGQTTTTARVPFASGVSAAAGTVAAAAYAATGDLNTGIYFPAADQVSFTAGGVDVLAATATGVTVTGTFATTGAYNVVGNFSVNTNKFNVTAASGNTTIAGTLGVTGAATLSSTLDVTGNVAVNTNKFNVTAASGNTTVAGILGVTGATTLSAALTVSAGGAAITGNSNVTGTLGVSSTLTASNGFTVSAGAVTLPSGSVANASLVSPPIFTKSFTSSQQTITAAGSLTLAHSLGTTPTLMQVRLVCIQAGGEAGYAQNDETPISLNCQDTDSSPGVAIVPDATNLNIRFGANAVTFRVLNKTTGSITDITNSKWKIVFYAWA